MTGTIGFMVGAVARRRSSTSNYALRSPAYFVAPASSSPAGSDSNAGTQAAPFLTLAHAQTAMRTGNKITYVRAGTYTPSSITITSADNGTTYSNYPGEVAVLDGGNSATFCFLTSGSGISGIWANGFTIQNYTTAAFKFLFFTGLKVTNCTFTNISPSSPDTAHAVVTMPSGGNDVTFANNRVNSCGGPATQITSGGDGFYITDNILLSCATAFADNGVIYSYDYQNSTAPILHYHATGNIVGDHGNNTTNLQSAFYLDDLTSGSNFFGNWVYGVGQLSIQIHGGINNVVTNNVFDITASGSFGYFLPAIESNPGGAGNVVSNNIIYSGSATAPKTQGGGGPNGMWDLDHTSLTVLNPVVKHNLLFDPNLTLPNIGIQTNPSATINPMDTAVTNGDPLFVSVVSHNYALGGGSPALTTPVNFIPVTPGAGPSLKGLPPVWTAAAGNILRNPNPTVGSVLGGALPTNWSNDGGSALAGVVVGKGTMNTGEPFIRMRWQGTTSGTAIQLNFDTAAPSSAGHTYNHTAIISICGGTLDGLTNFFMYNVAQDVSNASLGALSSAQITLTGTPTLINTPCTVTPAGTVTVLNFLIFGCTTATAVDITLQIAVPQLS